jgi:hypothetical protein
MIRTATLSALLVFSRHTLCAHPIGLHCWRDLDTRGPQLPSETFVSSNIQRGLEILNGKELRPDPQRRISDFFLSIVDTDASRSLRSASGRTASLSDQINLLRRSGLRRSQLNVLYPVCWPNPDRLRVDRAGSADVVVMTT